MSKKTNKSIRKPTNRVKHSKLEILDNFRPLIILISILSLTVTGLYFSAKAVNNTSTIVTTLPDTYTITGSSIDLDLDEVIELPSSGWSDTSDRISIEVSITNGSADDAIVDRSTDGCMVQISSSTTTSTFGNTALSNGSQNLDGDGTDNVFVFNDRTAQVTLLGIASEVKEAIGRVRASCSSQSVFAGKYIRVGAVPTIGFSGGGGSGTTACGDANTDCENLYYLFSTQHYYRVARMTSGVSSGTQGILDVWNKAKSITVGVDGTRKSGATIRGFVATLHTRDELLLTDAIRGTGNSSLSMIGTTDLTQSFTYDTNWGGSGSACSTDEGTFYWLGPDMWCRLIPTWNANNERTIEYSPNAQASNNSPNHQESRYWSRDSSGIWSRGTSSSFTIDLGSSTIPTTEDQSGTHNGYNFFHGWHSNTTPDEPNSSGDYIYLGYGGSGGNPGWDDGFPGDSNDRAGPDDRTISGRFIQEFCNPNQTCTPDANAVDSAQFKIAQTITFSGAASAYATETVNLTAASTTSGLTISYATNNSNICTVSSSAVVTLVSRGTCEVTASQSGNDDYLAATSVTQTFTSNFGPVFVGVVTSCTGIGQLENGSFEEFELGTAGGNSSQPTGQWHGYPRNPEGPTQILFLDLDAGLNQSVSPWDTGAANKFIELQRVAPGQTADTSGTLNHDAANVPPQDGEVFAELNATSVSYLFQDVATLPGSVLRWEIFHRGRGYTPGTAGDGDVMKVQIGATNASGYGSSTSQTVDQSPESGFDVNQSGTSGSISGSQITTERSDGWQRVRGVYQVPTGQTTTRFAFSGISGIVSVTVGNLLDNISFTPNVACPFTKSIITGRTATINVFDDEALTDAEESIAGDDSTIANTISVISGSGTVTRANSNRSMQFTAPNSTGTSVVRFRVTNSFGDTADADATFNIVSDLSHVAPTVIPVDPRATQVDLPQVDVVGSTVSKAMVCYVQTDSSGNTLGTPNINSQVRTPGSNTVSTTSATSAELSINGAIADVESASTSVRITSTTLNGRVLDTNTSKYIRIRTSGDDDVSTESCGNGTGASRQTVLELRPVQLETTRNLNVEIN